jgi:hypothetical protein
VVELLRGAADRCVPLRLRAAARGRVAADRLAPERIGHGLVLVIADQPNKKASTTAFSVSCTSRSRPAEPAEPRALRVRGPGAHGPGRCGRRQLLEQRFRFTEKDRKDWLENPAHEAPLERLPVMFCSPTMELGVDISALNTVYLRNVPPTPANYAQRSGRAGRSGQQALVITYCARTQPARPVVLPPCHEMVHGVVRRPRSTWQPRSDRQPPARCLAGQHAQVQLDTSIAPTARPRKARQATRASACSALEAQEVTARATASGERLIAPGSAELCQQWLVHSCPCRQHHAAAPPSSAGPSAAGA